MPGSLLHFCVLEYYVSPSELTAEGQLNYYPIILNCIVERQKFQ